eukprot:1369958-Pyramimonas_sp.AAC.1
MEGISDPKKAAPALVAALRAGRGVGLLAEPARVPRREPGPWEPDREDIENLRKLVKDYVEPSAEESIVRARA